MIRDNFSCPNWLCWFDQVDGLFLKSRATLPVVPIANLTSLEVDEACARLDSAWQDVFIPTQQHLTILRLLVDEASRYARSRFPDFGAYTVWRNMPRLLSSEWSQIRCLTGLSGVGKSSLIKALVRVCQPENGLAYNHTGHNLLLFPIKRIRVRSGQTASGVLNDLANPLFGEVQRGQKVHHHVMDWLLATATSLLVVDEMQFLTPSENASTRATQIIMQLGDLGPPLFYVANYSLVHKLIDDRYSEQKNRLLIEPIVVQPPSADSEDWKSILAEFLRVSPGSFDLDPIRDGAEIHRLSYGLFRYLGRLLIQAYRMARNDGCNVVKMPHLLNAYRSSAFTAYRQDIEVLHSLAVCDLYRTKRRDLVCPLQSIFDPLDKTVVASGALQTFSETARVSALLESTLTPGQRRTLDELRSAADKPSPAKPRANVTTLHAQKQTTASSLRDGDDVFQSMLRSSSAKRGGQ